MWDYIVYISNYGADRGIWTLSSSNNMFDEVKNYVPLAFNWPLFWLGQGIIWFTIFIIYKRLKIA
jgi:hypothetical protein